MSLVKKKVNMNFVKKTILKANKPSHLRLISLQDDVCETSSDKKNNVFKISTEKRKAS